MSNLGGKYAKPAAVLSVAGQRYGSSPDVAFDLWLQRGLHQIYGDVAKEPIPAELMALIEASRKASLK